MLRIGEVAELAGVSTRTVRHYHQIGLLPEPTRTPNGYRGYEARDVVLLLRIRQLVETGRHLDEIADVLAADRDRPARDILVELDTDLAEQEHRIRLRRKRIAELLAGHDASTFSVELADLLTDVERTETDQPATDQPAPDRQEWTAQMFRALTSELSSPHDARHATPAGQAVAAQLGELSRAYHRLIGRPTNDPAITDLAGRLARLGPAVLRHASEFAPASVEGTPDVPADAAQAQCHRLLLTYLRELP